jgi:hypothetical protein
MALYFHETKERFEGKIQIVPGFLLDMNDVELNNQSKELINTINKLTEPLGEKGANPEAFTYKVMIDKQNASIIEMKFYGETKAYAIMKHDKLGMRP